MKLSDVQTVVAAMAAIDLSTPNEGGNVREAQRAVKKIPLECFDGAKAIFIDSDKKEYPAVLTGARIDWISRTEINASEAEMREKLFAFKPGLQHLDLLKWPKPVDVTLEVFGTKGTLLVDTFAPNIYLQPEPEYVTAEEFEPEMAVA